MKKKYTINSQEVTKKRFFKMLRGDCRKVIETTEAGGLGVDLSDFDEKKYQHTLRSLRSGHMVLFLDAGRTYAYQQIC